MESIEDQLGNFEDFDGIIFKTKYNKYNYYIESFNNGSKAKVYWSTTIKYRKFSERDLNIENFNDILDKYAVYDNYNYIREFFDSKSWTILSKNKIV